MGEPLTDVRALWASTEPSRIIGYNWAYCWIDEPRKPPKWQRDWQRRARRRRRR